MWQIDLLKIFQYSLRIVGFRDRLPGPMPSGREWPFQYSLRIVGFRDMPVLEVTMPPLHPFSIPCESWGSATQMRESTERAIRKAAFSIPCESWGSATAPFLPA